MLGDTVEANRLIALVFAIVISVGLYLALTRTRYGTAVRAVAVDPVAARLVGIDVERAAGFAFALGGALAAGGGVLISMFLTFTASRGVVFTMKALIVVIMGGVGNLAGALVAGLMLGLAEIAVARLVDPGLTIAVTYRAVPRRAAVAAGRGLFGSAARDAAAPLAGPAAVRSRAALAAVPFVADVASGSRLARSASSRTTRCSPPPGRCSPGRRATSRSRRSPSSASAPIRWRCSARRMPVAGGHRIAAAIGIAVALVVGLSTLRLRGVYFVIFTFGLAELIRQIVSWYEDQLPTARSAATSSSTSPRSRSTGSCSRSSCSCCWPAGCSVRSRLGLALRGHRRTTRWWRATPASTPPRAKLDVRDRRAVHDA